MGIGGDTLELPRPFRLPRRNGSKEEAEAGDFGCSGWMGSGVREWGGKYGKYSRAGGRVWWKRVMVMAMTRLKK